jgi:UDPglucose--hexose-1-phosphate uridylyltransferase
MRTSTVTLADGRELVYYDRDGAPERSGEDTRPPEPRIVAAGRQERTYLPAPDDCPLCPSRPGHATEVPAADYGVAVLENRFPSLSGSALSVVDPSGGGQFSRRPGSGRCEVVCFSADHDKSFVDLGEEQAALVLEAWIDRTRTLATLPAVEQVFCFENRGVEVGVTLQHPHGQIYAYPYVTPRTSRMLASVAAYHRRSGRNLFDDVLAAERAEQSRIVVEDAEWTAFVPHAARWPYEVHLYPNRRVPDICDLDDSACASFVTVYLDLLARFEKLFDGKTPYLSGWHQAPVREGRDQFALHLEIFSPRRAPGKLKYLASSESGMGAFANDVLPEAAARRLRELGR